MIHFRSDPDLSRGLPPSLPFSLDDFALRSVLILPIAAATCLREIRLWQCGQIM
jgi:hypothetical protein